MITGHHLLTVDGDDVGEITDVIGGEEIGTPPRWLTVKTGLFSGRRLVPYEIVVQRADGQLMTPLSKADIKSAPKVPVQVEPIGDDLDDLRRHYALN